MAAALNIGPRTIRTPRLEGSGGAFMLTRGEPRYQQMNGRHYVVGRGAAYEHPTAVDACKHRDELLNAERAARRGRKDAARAAYLDAPPVQTDLKVGDRVYFTEAGRRTEGRVAEIGRRAISVLDDAGNTWLRLPGVLARV